MEGELAVELLPTGLPTGEGLPRTHYPSTYTCHVHMPRTHYPSTWPLHLIPEGQSCLGSQRLGGHCCLVCMGMRITYRIVQRAQSRHMTRHMTRALDLPKRRSDRGHMGWHMGWHFPPLLLDLGRHFTPLAMGLDFGHPLQILLFGHRPLCGGFLRRFAQQHFCTSTMLRSVPDPCGPER